MSSTKVDEKVSDQTIIESLDKLVNAVLPVLRLNQSARRVMHRGAKSSPGMLTAINVCCAIKNILAAAKRTKKQTKCKNVSK